MNANIPSIFIFIVLPVFGAIAVITAIAFHKRLAENPEIIEFRQLKIHATAFTILFLIGTILLCVGVFYWIKGFEREAIDFKTRIAEAEAQNNLLSKQLEKFKLYTLRFNLVFPERPVFGNPIKAQAYVSKQNEGPMELTKCTSYSDPRGDVCIKMDYLSPGDQIRLVVFDSDGNSWENAFIVEVPIISLEMRRSR